MEELNDGQTVRRTTGKKTSTKQARAWILTLNNYREQEVIQAWEWIEEYCNYAIFGFEYSEDGTPHIQGYFRTRQTLKMRYLDYGGLIPIQ